MGFVVSIVGLKIAIRNFFEKQRHLSSSSLTVFCSDIPLSCRYVSELLARKKSDTLSLCAQFIRFESAFAVVHFVLVLMLLCINKAVSTLLPWVVCLFLDAPNNGGEDGI